MSNPLLKSFQGLIIRLNNHNRTGRICKKLPLMTVDIRHANFG